MWYILGERVNDMGPHPLSMRSTPTPTDTSPRHQHGQTAANWERLTTTTQHFACVFVFFFLRQEPPPTDIYVLPTLYVRKRRR